MEGNNEKKRAPIPRSILLSVVFSYVCAVALVAASLVYSAHVEKQNDQRWCSVLIAIDDAYAEATNNPNVSRSGRHIGEEFHRLRIEFGC